MVCYFKLFLLLNIASITILAQICREFSNYCEYCNKLTNLCAKCQYSDILVLDKNGGSIGAKKCILGKNNCNECDIDDHLCKTCDENYYPHENG